MKDKPVDWFSRLAVAEQLALVKAKHGQLTAADFYAAALRIRGEEYLARRAGASSDSSQEVLDFLDEAFWNKDEEDAYFVLEAGEAVDEMLTEWRNRSHRGPASTRTA